MLFADVVRSMDLAAELDIERLREVMTDLLERAVAVAHRYGGDTVEYTGDGLMVLFGAPIALEDHAFRACLAALSMQDEAHRQAAEILDRDGVTLQLRIGMNSGRVIAGELGAGTPRYAATGETVGFAQRMESVAPPGGVMLSENTARLVEHTAQLAEPQWLHIKGRERPVRGRRLVSIGPRVAASRGTEATLVGRRGELAAISSALERTTAECGGALTVVGPPGIGKSRLAREAAAAAAGRGVEVFWAFCESHTGDAPFHVISRLLRSAHGIADLDGPTARVSVRQQVPAADPDDLLLLDDLLGIAEPNISVPQMDPEVRRRRLTAMISTWAMARRRPTLFVVEDVHWIDPVSESMLADLLTVLPRTSTMVLMTSRPTHEGVLLRGDKAQMMALDPLMDAEVVTLLDEWLGSDPSVHRLAAAITERAAGNPFFVEEMVLEMVQRGVLDGERGGYTTRTDATDLSVPATVAAAIGARIDLLGSAARLTLNAASVIGERFGEELLSALGFDAAFDEPLKAELIELVRPGPSAEYAFRHPLIRAVTYESQLKSERAQWHRRVATAIQERAPDLAQENATLIAGHLESAGEAHTAYGWYMSAAAWCNTRDVGAARISWDKARRIADELPVEDPGRLPMRIAARTMLCATGGWGNAGATSHDNLGRFEELRVLCSAAGDKISLAIGMSGVITELMYTGRSRQGSPLASEQMTLLESLDDHTPMVGLAFVAFCNWSDSGELSETLRWTQAVIDAAHGDAAMGSAFGLTSPLATALAFRSTARWWLGRPGWRDDLDEAIELAGRSDPGVLAIVIGWTYGLAVLYGVVRVDEPALDTIETALSIVAQAGNDIAVGLVTFTMASALLNRDSAAERRRGLDLMLQFRDLSLKAGVPAMAPVADTWIAREKAHHGDREAAVADMNRAVEELHHRERLGFGIWATRVLVETLLDSGAEDDLTKAQQVIDRLADLRADDASAVRDITLLQLRTLLARARRDDTYPKLLGRYVALSTSLGFDGHTAWAEAMALGNATDTCSDS